MNKNNLNTIGGVLLHSAEQFPNNNAVVFPEQKQNFSELAKNALQRAKALKALGVSPGDNVGILLPTCMDFPEIFFAVALCGAVSVPINTRNQSSELGYVINNGDLVTVITTDIVADHVHFAERIANALPGLPQQQDLLRLNLTDFPTLRNLVILGSSKEPGFISEAQLNELAEDIDTQTIVETTSSIDENSPGLMLYTSGTTSNPKGCPINHRAMVQNSRALAERYKLTEADRFWSPLPLCHIAGILPMLAIFSKGGNYLTMSYFDPAQALNMLQHYQATAAYPCFVTIISDLVNHDDFATTDLSSMRVMNSNFAVQPKELADTVSKAMPTAIQVGTFGMTETAGTICTHKLSEPLETRLTTLGTPLQGWDVKIIDPENRQQVSAGQRGEILARGSNLCNGYYKDPQKTRQSFDKDGWFHTGDVGSFDEQGQIMFHGRLKDMLKVGGENVAAAEIEAYLHKHPAVLLAQVVAIPDARLGEIPVAFIELNSDDTVDGSNNSVDEQTLIDFCRGAIAGFKVPRHVRFVESWPMSTSKIQKFKLRDRILTELKKAT